MKTQLVQLRIKTDSEHGPKQQRPIPFTASEHWLKVPPYSSPTDEDVAVVQVVDLYLVALVQQQHSALIQV